MTFLSDGTTWLASNLRDAAGTVVSIKRGSFTTTGITSVADSADYQVTSDDGIVNRVRYRDWFVAMSDYAFSDVATTPKAGDRVIDDAAKEWELAPIGNLDAFADWDGTTWILHTRRVKG